MEFLFFQVENLYAGQLAQAEFVFNQPEIGQVDGSADAIVGDPYAEETMPMEDSENGVFTVRAEEDDEDDDQDPPERRDRQNERPVRQDRQNERSQRQNAFEEDELDDLNDRPLTQPNPARQLSQTFSDDSDEEEISKKRSNLGFSHFFSSCGEFSFTNCNFSL